LIVAGTSVLILIKKAPFKVRNNFSILAEEMFKESLN